MTDNSALSLPPILLAAQIAHEMLDYRWPPWRTDEPPNVPRTYLCRCVNGDGNTYAACHYWYKRWASAGPFVRVTGWCELPPV